MILYRPVGLAELELIYDLNFNAFPPRLDWQPIFYPVVNEDYAIQIAKDWNTKDENSQYIGFVTKFEIDDKFISKYKTQIVGASIHEEYWIPSEELNDFNENIIGEIQVIKAYTNKHYKGVMGEIGNLKEKNIIEQISVLLTLIDYSTFDLSFDLELNKRAIFFNYPYFKIVDEIRDDIDTDTKDKLIKYIKILWDHKKLFPPLIENSFYNEGS